MVQGYRCRNGTTPPSPYGEERLHNQNASENAWDESSRHGKVGLRFRSGTLGVVTETYNDDSAYIGNTNMRGPVPIVIDNARRAHPLWKVCSVINLNNR